MDYNFEYKQTYKKMLGRELFNKKHVCLLKKRYGKVSKTPIYTSAFPCVFTIQAENTWMYCQKERIRCLGRAVSSKATR